MSTETPTRPVEAPVEGVSVPETPKKRGPNKAILFPVIGVLALAAIWKGYSAYTWGQTHVETDNAYVTGDLVNISPTVSGTLTELRVQDGDFVKKGTVIARLDTDAAQAELAQAQANLQAAQSGVPQAEAALSYERLSTQAAIQRSEAALAAKNASTEGSRLQVQLSADTVRNQVKQAQSTLAQAQAQAAQAQAGIATARAALASARQAVLTAQRNADASNAVVGASKADADRAAGDLERYRKLLAGDAISRQQYDTAAATSAAATANLTGAQQRAQAAVSQVAQARAAVVQAQAGLVAAQRQADAAGKQVQVAQAGVDLARASGTQVGIRGADVRTSTGEAGQASADLAAAQAGNQQVTLREKQVASARAQVLQAKAAVDRAKVQVRDSTLVAPCDGYVVKHTVNVGTAINPGQTVVTITRGNDVWVMANYKETQLTDVREGQPAEIEIDTFPGKKFHGKVLSVLRATGSATALLPPDNATGNFTKVVQRVPVKISLAPEPGSENVANQVRQGMSVVATIDTSGKGGE